MKIISVYIFVLFITTQFVQNTVENHLNHFSYSFSAPLKCVNFQEDRYTEGVIHYYSFVDGGSIIIVEGSLLEFPMDYNLRAAKNKGVRTKRVDGLWDGIKCFDDLTNVRVYFTHVKRKNLKKYVKVINRVRLRSKQMGGASSSVSGTSGNLTVL